MTTSTASTSSNPPNDQLATLASAAAMTGCYDNMAWFLSADHDSTPRLKYIYAYQRDQPDKFMLKCKFAHPPAISVSKTRPIFDVTFEEVTKYTGVGDQAPTKLNTLSYTFHAQKCRQLVESDCLDSVTFSEQHHYESLERLAQMADQKASLQVMRELLLGLFTETAQHITKSKLLQHSSEATCIWGRRTR
jgi:hypothetical protein